jgi:prepilin-type N-terminal cleavage/methylation domain-containing protein
MTPGRAGRAHPEAGTTLVELLVAMAVMGVIFALAGPTLLSAIGATDRLAATQSAIDDAQLVSARLDRELRSAICISTPAENTSGNVLSFETLSDGERAAVTYTVAEGRVEREEAGHVDVLATRVGATTSAFTQVATPLRTVRLALPIRSEHGGAFLLETTIAGRNAWRSC